MEALELDDGEDEEVSIGAVMTIVEVRKREGEEQYQSVVRVRHNVADVFGAIGVLRAAEQQIIG
jgi:hypothetical protein